MLQIKIWNSIIHFLVTFDHTVRGKKDLELYLAGKCWSWTLLILTAPFISQKKFVPIIGFMVLKTTGLGSRFQRTNWFWKVCPKSRDINQTVPKFRSPNQACIFSDVSANISRPFAYFSKPIFALKPWAQAGRFEYHEPYNRKNFFCLTFKGGCQYLKGPGPPLPELRLIQIFFLWSCLHKCNQKTYWAL